VHNGYDIHKNQKGVRDWVAQAAGTETFWAPGGGREGEGAAAQGA
jgi:hypothetical protein